MRPLLSQPLFLAEFVLVCRRPGNSLLLHHLIYHLSRMCRVDFALVFCRILEQVQRDGANGGAWVLLESLGEAPVLGKEIPRVPARAQFAQRPSPNRVVI